MHKPVFAKFGQELYPRETIEAAALLASGCSGRDVTDRVAAGLSHASPSTRARVADKLVQRLRAGAGGSSALPAFVRLLSATPDSESRRELVFYGAAQADALIGEIAREVLYPFFITHGLPTGATPDQMGPQSAGLLLTVEPAIPLRAVLDYIERRWGFHSPRCVLLSLRILRQAGILLTERLRGSQGSHLACSLAPHGLSFAAFVWCLLDEFGADPAPPSIDRIERSRFARTFVVPPSVVLARMQQAERERFVAYSGSGGGRRARLLVSPDEAVERLLA